MPDILTLDEGYKPEILILTKEETKSLERIFFKIWHNQEDEEAHKIMRKIMNFNRGK